MMMMLSKYAGSSSSALSRQRRAALLSFSGIMPPVMDVLSAAHSSRTITRSPDFKIDQTSSSSSSSSRRSLSYYQQQPPYSPDGRYGGGGGVGGRSPSSSSSSGPLRAFPAYAVFGETCLLSVKLLPPLFRVQPSTNTLLLDSNKKGRILLEWTPRVANGRLSRDKESQLRFGLSAEEVGLMLDQLPANIVEFSRRPTTMTPSGGGGGQPSEFGIITANTTSTTDDVPDKVLRITPGEGGSVSFLIDYELNGVSVAPPPSVTSASSSSSSTSTTTGPLVVVAQLGEFQVIRELLRSSIPVLVGWNTMVEIAMQRSFENMQNNNSPGGYGGGEHTF